MTDEQIRILWHLNNSEPYDAFAIVGPQQMIKADRLDDVLEGYYQPDEQIGESDITASELFDEAKRKALLEYVASMPSDRRMVVAAMNRRAGFGFPGSVVKDISVTRWGGRPPAE